MLELGANGRVGRRPLLGEYIVKLAVRRIVLLGRGLELGLGVLETRVSGRVGRYERLGQHVVNLVALDEKHFAARHAGCLPRARHRRLRIDKVFVGLRPEAPKS